MFEVLCRYQDSSTIIYVGYYLLTKALEKKKSFY